MICLWKSHGILLCSTCRYPPIRLCYHMHGKLIFNWWTMHPLKYTYCRHNISIVPPARCHCLWAQWKHRSYLAWANVIALKLHRKKKILWQNNLEVNSPHAWPTSKRPPSGLLSCILATVQYCAEEYSYLGVFLSAVTIWSLPFVLVSCC